MHQKQGPENAYGNKEGKTKMPEFQLNAALARLDTFKSNFSYQCNLRKFCQLG